MSIPPDLKNKVIILGVKIDDAAESFIFEKIEDFLHSNTSHIIFTPNPEICLRASENETYRDALNKADINIPDGMGLKFGAIILGQTLKNRITGSTLTKTLLEKYNQQGIRVYVVRRTDSLSSAADLQKIFQKNYSQIEFKSGDVDVANHKNDAGLINDINNFAPHFLFITLGAPYQEFWVDQFIKQMPSVKVALGIGGSLDFLTGKMKRAPKVMRDFGFEWLYRLYLEPKRLKRIKNALAIFLLKCHEWNQRIKTTMRPNIVGIIKNKNGKFLVQKNKRLQQWQFPQGGVNKNENEEQAIVREAGEELGIDKNLLKVIKRLPAEHEYVWPRYAQLLRGYKGQQQIAFLLEFSGTDSDLHYASSVEVDAVQWVEKDNLINSLHPVRRDLAKDNLQYI